MINIIRNYFKNLLGQTTPNKDIIDTVVSPVKAAEPAKIEEPVKVKKAKKSRAKKSKIL